MCRCYAPASNARAMMSISPGVLDASPRSMGWSVSMLLAPGAIRCHLVRQTSQRAAHWLGLNMDRISVREGAWFRGCRARPDFDGGWLSQLVLVRCRSRRWTPPTPAGHKTITMLGGASSGKTIPGSALRLLSHTADQQLGTPAT